VKTFPNAAGKLLKTVHVGDPLQLRNTPDDDILSGSWRLFDVIHRIPVALVFTVLVA